MYKLLNTLLVLLMLCATHVSYAQYSEDLVKKAEAGDAQAQSELGLCYVRGDGVTRDDEEAVKWWLKAAEQGHADAQCYLGVCYVMGQGVTQDYAEAVKWFTKAAEQGYAEAQNELGLYYVKGDGVTQDDEEAVKWFTKAAEQGYAEAQYNMGICYEDGIGVEQDLDKAITWYTKAAEQGHADAIEALQALAPEDAPDDEVVEEEVESMSLNDIRFAGWTDKDWLNNDYIRELRKYIDAYNRGEIENPNLDEYKDILKGKFVIGEIEPYIMGGVFIRFLFIDYPQVCFETGIYSDVDEEKGTVTGYRVIDVRCIGDDMDGMTKEEVLEIMKEHPELIAW